MSVRHIVIASVYGITQGTAAACLCTYVCWSELECVEYLKPPSINQCQITIKAIYDFEAIIT